MSGEQDTQKDSVIDLTTSSDDEGKRQSRTTDLTTTDRTSLAAASDGNKTMMKLKLAVSGERNDNNNDDKNVLLLSIASDASVQELYALAANALGLAATTLLTLKAGWPPQVLSGTARIDAVLTSHEKIHASIASTTLATSSSSFATTAGNPSPRSQPQAAAKRPRTDDMPASQTKNKPTQDSPFKLFQTALDKQSTNPLVREHCLSLRQMLGLDYSTSGYQMDTRTSVDWLCISNFIVDFDFLLQAMPELVSIPTSLVFYQTDCSPLQNGMARWKEAAGGNVTFVPLDPKAEPRGRDGNDPNSHNPLRYKFRYGCHHTKMFLVGRSNGTLRVIVHTSNLMAQDTAKTQGAFIQDFPLKTTTPAASQTSSQFEDDLVDYLTTYDYETRHPWNGRNAKTLCEEIRRYDFRGARGVLIASTPGYYDLNTAVANNRGYLKLKRAIREHCPAASSSSAPIVCQFSSVGSLSAKYLQSFATALNAAQTPFTNLNESLKLVFPTPECIRRSVEGYRGGGTVPSKKSNVNKPFLRPLWHKWASSAATTSNPLHKPINVPHIKSYYQQGRRGEQTMQWFCLTSHNLSKAAWGECRTNDRGSHLYVMHWELGVFTAPSMWGDGATMGPIGMTTTGNGEVSRIGIPLPYAVDPTPYGPNEGPFSWEETYPTAPDAYGRVGVNDGVLGL